MLASLIGFIIALVIALTGIGAGTLTTPLLILWLGVPAPSAVSTGLVYSAIIKLVLIPTQIARKLVDWRVLGRMALGGLPGVLVGSWAIAQMGRVADASRPITAIVGSLLILATICQIVDASRPAAQVGTRIGKGHWVPVIMFPIDMEVGFSSLGAGALGTAALLSATTLTPAQVVATDLLFGFVLSAVGGGVHWLSNRGDTYLLQHLIMGGIPGEIVGTLGSAAIPRHALRVALWIALLLIGTDLIHTSFYK